IFPASETLGTGRDAKMDEIDKDVMPTIALHLLRLPKDGRHEMPRNTVNSIYAVSSGKARITAEGFSEVLAVGDVAAMPCWHAHAIEAVEDTVLPRRSDEPLMSKVGLLRAAG